MHMADALPSPEIGGVMWAATAAATLYSAHKVQNQLDSKKIPLMGVPGAFVFAAQMINFAIPGTGSSGHLAAAFF
jgi:cobalt/nickel transport system permease protein